MDQFMGNESRDAHLDPCTAALYCTVVTYSKRGQPDIANAIKTYLEHGKRQKTHIDQRQDYTEGDAIIPNNIGVEWNGKVR